ncbi:putative mitochondrial carrier C8C9.12c [Pseudocercospora fuligena]|uniref:Putative mitochondrial carrier C8C9.12c n=1 Tax=Pseudocercospora fuligena TaxID=685502 RepID=A0A8H6RTZ9_9PEZI|nr:putative mitochondrial carrier C8C9.12c [Pseudocercospora fuligena]
MSTSSTPLATVESIVAQPRAMAAHDKLVLEEAEEYDYESLPPNFSLAANMAAGAFAGIAEHSVMYPIDLLKTRMQVVNANPAAIYSGIGNAIATISRVEGYMSLWRGLSSVIVGAGPAHAVYFATYEVVKQAMGGNASGHHPIAAASSGACATIASDAFMNPFDVIKQRMQLHGSTYRSIVDCASQVWRREGLRAFYVSYPTTLTMTVPFTALQFTAYESLTKVMQRRRAPGYDPLTHCTAGGLAGGLAAAATTPLDVIKTLLQTRGTSTDAEIRNCRGLFPAASIIWRREGAKGFFRGMKPRVITAAPSTAVCWSAYELAKAYFIRVNEES